MLAAALGSVQELGQAQELQAAQQRVWRELDSGLGPALRPGEKLAPVQEKALPRGLAPARVRERAFAPPRSLRP
jgi:hypothetical protein